MQIDELTGWLAGKLPAILLSAPPEVRLYPDEAVIVLQLEPPAASHDPAHQFAAEHALLAQQREATRTLRMKLANEIQPRLGVPVAWGMRVGSSELLFTTRSVPVMTRLGRAERDVLDTLVAAGVAETRSSALAYAVRAFAAEHGPWLAQVREAIGEVQRVRAQLTLAPRPGPPVVEQVEA